MTTHNVKYGLLITALLIAYFFVLKLLGLHTYTVLSAFNGVIYGFGIYMAITSFKKTHSDFKYEEGFQSGLFSGFFATVLFTIVMAIYMFHINPEFADIILGRWERNYDNGPYLLVISVLLMGLATSFVLTLAFMQLLKDSWNTNQNKPN
tara:strand:- start:33257 stop:33706 length:450 start_codon:yes stop_codon:yes gene_type:complete